MHFTRPVTASSSRKKPSSTTFFYQELQLLIVYYLQTPVSSEAWQQCSSAQLSSLAADCRRTARHRRQLRCTCLGQGMPQGNRSRCKTGMPRSTSHCSTGCCCHPYTVNMRNVWVHGNKIFQKSEAYLLLFFFFSLVHFTDLSAGTVKHSKLVPACLLGCDPMKGARSVYQ
jgi:hypothetical protein